MLQRRKRYRNRTILGYKTLARGEVNLTQVLQKSQDKQLELYNANKESCRNSIGFIVVQNLTTLPVNEEQNGGAGRIKERVFFSQNSEAERSPEGELSEDDLEDDSSEEDLSEDEERMERMNRRRKMQTRFRHSNIKEKLRAFLKNFKRGNYLFFMNTSSGLFFSFFFSINLIKKSENEF